MVDPQITIGGCNARCRTIWWWDVPAAIPGGRFTLGSGDARELGAGPEIYVGVILGHDYVAEAVFPGTCTAAQRLAAELKRQ